MARIAILILIGFFLGASGNLIAQSLDEMVDVCASQVGDDATYLKDFQVTLGESTNGRPQVARYPLVLSSNNIYRFSVCDLESSQGKAVIKLYDNNRLIFSSFTEETQEEFNPFNFMCRKTGIYHVFISFLDGKPGEAVGILSYVAKK
ncbi:hypothetical protein ACFLR8_00575 [Bacteroidota bacterium]